MISIVSNPNKIVLVFIVSFWIETTVIKFKICFGPKQMFVSKQVLRSIKCIYKLEVILDLTVYFRSRKKETLKLRSPTRIVSTGHCKLLQLTFVVIWAGSR